MGSAMHLQRMVLRVGAVAMLLLVLAGCAVRLLPEHDALLFNKLNALNEQTLVLFSAVRSGAPADSFSRYEANYDDIIGGYDALRMIAEARPVPQFGRVGVTQKVAERACGLGSSIADCINATPGNLNAIVTGLTTMRNSHRSAGLPSDIVALFRKEYEIAIQQVLVLEAALKR